jgi:DivIVA domain-containing protein
MERPPGRRPDPISGAAAGAGGRRFRLPEHRLLASLIAAGRLSVHVGCVVTPHRVLLASVEQRERQRVEAHVDERERPTAVLRARVPRGPVPRDVRDISFHIAVRGYDRREVDRYVERVNHVIAELEITQSPESVVRNALERVGEQTSGILQQAREAAEEIVESARAEGEESIERAAAEAAQLVAGARAKADATLADAAEEAQERIARGDEELESARTHAAETRAEAESTLADARANAQDLLAQATEQAAQKVADAEALAAERSALEEQRLEERRIKAESELRALQEHIDAVEVERRRLVEEAHELAARLEAVADSGAAAAAPGAEAAEAGAAHAREDGSEDTREPTGVEVWRTQQAED